MSNIKEKIKSVLPGHSHSTKEGTLQGETRYGEERNVMGTGTGTGTGLGTTGAYETQTTGAAGYGVVGDRREGDYGEGYEREGAYDTTGVATTGVTTTGEAATCGREGFTKIEDRPIIRERKVST
jgi:hypothetical protein